MVTAATGTVDSLYQSSTSTSTLGSDSVDRQDFLTLLVAQLQNQDPMNPVENQEFVAQLATFSSLEQQQMQTKLLQQLIDSQNNNTSAQALSLIGKEASVAVDQFTLQANQSIDFTFLATETGTEPVQIFDSKGKLVRSDLVSVSNIGEVPYHFDGKDNQKNSLPAGDYTIQIGSTMDEEGNVASCQTYIRGYVEGVTYVDGEPILIVDGNAVPFSEVYGVYERSDLN